MLSGGSPAGLAEWIGREVRVAAKADFAGEPIEVGVAPAAGADRAVLVVKNDFDQEVARLTVPADAETVTWDGQDDLGRTLADGRYGFTLEWRIPLSKLTDCRDCYARPRWPSPVAPGFFSLSDSRSLARHCTITPVQRRST